MGIQAASLIAKVSAEGSEETERKLESVGRKSDETRGHFDMLKGALSFAGGQLLFQGASDAFGFLKDQLGAVFKESSDAADELAQTNQVLKSTHDVSGMTTQSILDMAGSLSHLTKFTDDQVQVGENMLLTFTNIGKNVFPQATQTMLDMSQALGQDVTSSAIQLGKALGEPLTGMTALQRVGVTFDDTQKKLIKTYMEHNQVAKAQGVILQELQKEFGGSAEAAGKTAAGQWAIFNQRLDDVRQTIGDALMPVLTNLMSFVETTALPVLERFGDWFVKTAIPAIQPFVTMFEQAGSALLQVMAPVQQVQTAFSNLNQTVDASIYFAKPITDAWDRGSISVKNLGTAIGPVTDAYDRHNKTLDTVKNSHKVYTDALDRGSIAITNYGTHHAAATQTINPFTAAIQDLLPYVGKFSDWVVKTAMPNLQHLGDWFVKTGVPVIKELADSVLKNLLPPLGDLITNVVNLGIHVTEWLQNSGFLKDAISTVSEVLGTLVGWVATFVGWLDQGNPLAWILVGAIGGIALAIEGVKLADWIYGWKSLGDTFKDLAQNLMPNYTASLKTTTKAAGETKDSVKAIATETTTTREVVTTETAVMEGDIAAVGTTAEVTAGKEGVGAIGAAASSAEGEVGVAATGMTGAFAGIAGSLGIGLVIAALGLVIAKLPDMAQALDDVSNTMIAKAPDVETAFNTTFQKTKGDIISAMEAASKQINIDQKGMADEAEKQAKRMDDAWSHASQDMNLHDLLATSGWTPAQIAKYTQGVAYSDNPNPTVHRHAAGTSFAPGGLSLLGEGKEPEIVMGPTLGNLTRGSQVIPFSQLRGGGSNAPIIHIHPPDLYLDGTRLTQAQMPYIANALRGSLGMVGM